MDIACGQILGQRRTQQDFIAQAMLSNSDAFGIVLSDGMGGQRAGQIASQLIVKAALACLEAQAFKLSAKTVRDVLRDAAEQANTALADRAESMGILGQTGGTLLIAIVLGKQLYWCSIGDSLLYLFRKGELKLLNDLHSVREDFSALAEKGLMNQRIASALQNSGQLTASVTGAQIRDIDISEKGFRLHEGDRVLIASDGLETLTDAEITATMTKTQTDQAAKTAYELLDFTEEKAVKGQDNLAVGIMRV